MGFIGLGGTYCDGGIEGVGCCSVHSRCSGERWWLRIDAAHSGDHEHRILQRECGSIRSEPAHTKFGVKAECECIAPRSTKYARASILGRRLGCGGSLGSLARAVDEGDGEGPGGSAGTGSLDVTEATCESHGAFVVEGEEDVVRL